MRAFQDAGHVGVLIVGDYTTRIGDPSGRSAERPILADEEIDANAQRYLEQAMVGSSTPSGPRCASTASGSAKLSLRRGRAARRGRSPSRGCSSATTSRSGSRRSEPISVSELLYPLMQAYDSVAIEADVELGGTDQLYNLLTGREVMQHYGLEPQVVLTTPLLDLVGRREDELVARQLHPARPQPPEEMFGQTMRIPDASCCRSGGTLVAERASRRRATRWRRSSSSRAGSSARSHGEEAARAARGALHARRRGAARRPRTCPTCALPDGDPVHLPALLVERVRRRSTSRGAAPDRPGRRQADGEPVGELDVPRAGSPARCSRSGKRRFVRLSNRLTAVRSGAILPRPSERGGVGKSLQPRRTGASRPDSYPIRFDSLGGLWRESEAFFTPSLQTTAPVFENSTANVQYVETSISRVGLRAVAVRGDTPRRRAFGTTTFEHQAQSEKTRRPVSAGEITSSRRV